MADDMRRQIKLDLKLQADDWTELLGALDAIRHRMFEAQERGEGGVRIISGGCGSGFHLTVDFDPSWTAERYRAALSEWSEARKKEREADRG